MLVVVALMLAIFWLPEPLGFAIVGAAVVVELAEIAFWVRWSRRRRAHTGSDALPGRTATVVSACRPRGHVRIDGELWSAVCEEGAGEGERVVVESLEGLTLAVRPERPAG